MSLKERKCYEEQYLLASLPPSASLHLVSACTSIRCGLPLLIRWFCHMPMLAGSSTRFSMPFSL